MSTTLVGDLTALLGPEGCSTVTGRGPTCGIRPRCRGSRAEPTRWPCLARSSRCSRWCPGATSTSSEQVARAAQAAEALFAEVLALDGTVSGEHGLGWVKRDQFDRQFPPLEASLQRSIKALFDPKNLFNPGKKLT